jgi:pSer/pThr/pTyr-binding forkhead associated (FHA) protein
VLGQGPGCAIRVAGDAAIAAEHAEFSIEGGEFVVVPREGRINVEGQGVERRHNLSDGETIAIGNSLFVFKCASSGNLATVAPPSARRSG